MGRVNRRKYAYREALAGAARGQLGLGGVAPSPGSGGQPGGGYGQGAWRGDPAAPLAPLPAAFRQFQAVGRPSCVEFHVLAQGPDGPYARTEYRSTDQAGMRRGVTRRIPSGDGSVPPSTSAGHGAEPAIETHENLPCLEQLSGLGSAGKIYEHEPHFTLADLGGFVTDLNKTRPSKLHFDTVILNTDMHDSLFKAYRGMPKPSYSCTSLGIRRPYQNMIDVTGVAKFLLHPCIPRGYAYAMSSMQAPVFVHGSSITKHTPDGLVITRECGFVDPPQGAPGCPWGVRFGVRVIRDVDDAQCRTWAAQGRRG